MTEEDSNFKAAVVGGGIGFAIGGPVGAGAGAAIAAWLNQSEAGSADELSIHDRTLLKTARGVEATSEARGGKSASFYIAHIDGNSFDLGDHGGGTGGVLESIEGEPDLIYNDVGGPTASMLVEVETARSLQDDVQHTVSQFERYRQGGYKTVLVVPHEDLAEAKKFVDEHGIRDPIHISSARSIAEVM